MAHSIQTFGDASELFNDFDLIALICMIVDEVSGAPDKFPTIGQTVGGWSASLAGYGPGLIDLNLDLIASTEHGAHEFESLLSSIVNRIDLLGEMVPASFLNNQSRAPGVTFSDYDGLILRQTVEKLRRLIATAHPGL